MIKEPNIFDLIMGVVNIIIIVAVFCIALLCIFEAFSRFGALGGVLVVSAFVSMSGCLKS